MLLFKNITLFSPYFLGTKDVLTSFDKIALISSNINSDILPDITVIDGAGLIMCPGFIDLHCHIAGGGGEGGFNTRTPELMLTDFTTAGITTCIGLLGTDGTTRSMGNLIAKSRALELEGLTTYIWTGCYEVPTRTITDSPRGDIILVDKIIGIGEIAISDHRSSRPSDKDLVFLATEARIGGMISGKAGLLHIHIGDSADGLDPILRLYQQWNIPLESILPTHINRNHNLFNQGIYYGEIGGYLDITTGIKPEKPDSMELDPGKAYKILLENKISPFNITMSSDSGGSMPIFDDNNKLVKLSSSSPKTTLEAFKSCLHEGIDFEKAIIPFTLSPARLLKLKSKGEIKEGLDADLLILDNNYNLKHVIAKGRIMIENYNITTLGTFQ